MVIAVALLAAAVLALPAGAVDRGQLARMPLTKEALGTAAAALMLAPGSGVLTNEESAADSLGEITAAGLARLGRITGYVRDYDDPRDRALRSGRGLLEVKTRVELYGSRAGAARGLAFWRSFDRRFGTITGAGDALVTSEFRVHGLGEVAFAIEFTLTVDGKPRVYEVDLLFRTKELLASLSVGAADRAGLRTRALTLAHRLQARIDRVRA